MFKLGQIKQQSLTSLPIYRFMNGSNVTFRYIAHDGAYRETVFDLAGSKQALNQALGKNVQILTE